MKYLVATVVLVFSLVLGWFFSARYLESMILEFFDPGSHEEYIDIWFSFFVSIELFFVLIFFFYIYKVYKSAP